MNLSPAVVRPALAAVLVVFAAGCGDRASRPSPLAAALQQRLAEAPDYAAADEEAWAAVKAAYAKNGGAPLWLGEKSERPEVEKLETAIVDAANDGLDYTRYDTGPLAALEPVRKGLLRKKRYEPAEAAEADVRLTFVSALLARDLAKGRVQPGQVDRHWFGAARKPDLGAMVHRAATSGDVAGALRSLAPRHPQYERLRQALNHHRKVAAGGGWPKVPASLKVKPGGLAPGVPALRARLAASGELPAEAAVGTLYDETLRQAVRRAESAYVLTPDGIVDAALLRELNVPVEERIRQIEINLERWRWLPEELGDPHILVNVPTYHLTVFEGQRPALQMRVVAGKPESPTPIFSDVMQTVVFSPYWNVPASILQEEIVPALREEPDYLEKQNMEVVRNNVAIDPQDADFEDPAVRVRQRPGTTNALGHVKFMFPNNFDVYLHDTPADSLFGRRERGFSHGCVRVEKPDELARWVLKDQPEWTPEKIRAAMFSGQERHVALGRKVPVYIVYQTVWADEDGAVRFAEDVYGHDERQRRMIPGSPPPGPVPAADRVAAAH